MHIYTFGKSLVHINMAKMLNELNNKKVNSRVSTFFNHYTHLLLSVEMSCDFKVFCSVSRLIVNDAKEKCKTFDIPEDCKSHLRNMVMAYERDLMRERLGENDYSKNLEYRTPYERMPSDYRRLYRDTVVVEGDWIWYKELNRYEVAKDSQIGTKIRSHFMVIRKKSSE